MGLDEATNLPAQPLATDAPGRCAGAAHPRVPRAGHAARISACSDGAARWKDLVHDVFLAAFKQQHRFSRASRARGLGWRRSRSTAAGACDGERCCISGGLKQRRVNRESRKAATSASSAMRRVNGFRDAGCGRLSPRGSRVDRAALSRGNSASPEISKIIGAADKVIHVRLHRAPQTPEGTAWQ